MFLVDGYVEIGVDWMPLDEAANMLGRPKSSVRRLVEAGKVRAGRSDRGMMLYNGEDLIRIVRDVPPSRRY